MERGDAANFARMGTLGVEEEFYVVDDAGRPTSATDELVYESEPPPLLEDRLAHELFKCVIETQTPIIESFDATRETVVAVRDALLEHARTHGFDIAGAGLHPAANWPALEHATKPRYREQLDRIQYPQHRNTTAGAHVHVGVDDADKAVWVANELRWYLPIILALSVNSPYWCGTDTGLQSARATIFESLPNTGMPTAFDSYAEFDAFEATMLEEGAIADRGELWFDVRPHSDHGTVEVRVADGQRDVAVVLGLAEYVHALVTDLSERYADGESGTDYRRELLDENKWRALRYGHEATLLDRDLADSVSLRGLVEREADRMDVPALLDLYDRESGASEQRRRYQQAGMDGLCTALLVAQG